MSENIYRKLQQRLDKYSLGFPATESGVEIKILKELFSEADAEMFLALSPVLETPESVAERIGQPAASVEEKLEDMARRKLLFRLKKGDTIKYGAIPFVHGLFEFHTTEMSQTLAELMEQYYQEGFKQTMVDNAENFLRTIPIQKSIDVTQHVAAFDDACEILQNTKKIVVTECTCRKQKNLLDKSCGKPLEVCFMFGAMGQYYIDNKMGREINANEAIEILKKCHAEGLVTQPATAQNPGGMCNCCGCCCGVLASLNEHPRPAEMVFSNYFAQVDQDACTGCETCMDRCQMGAISLNDDEVAEVNPARCIGCGLCVTTCPSDAMHLVPKEREKQRTPPKTSMDQMITMAQKRGINF